MKNYLWKLIFILPFLLLAGIGVVSAAPVIDDVCGNGNSNGLNVTGARTACQIDFRLDSGSANYASFVNNSAGTRTLINRNDSVGSVTSFNVSMDFSGIADGPWSFYVSQNYTNTSQTNVTISTVGFDNTVPTNSISCTAYIRSTAQQSCTITASDTGFTDGTNSCTAEDNINGNITATDAGSDSWTATFTPTRGRIHKIRSVCTDYHSFSSAYTDWVTYQASSGAGFESPPPGGNGQVSVTTPAAKANNNLIIFVAIVAVAYLLLRKKR